MERKHRYKHPIGESTSSLKQKKKNLEKTAKKSKIY